MSSEAASTTTPAPTTTAPSPVVAAPAPVTAAPTPTPTAETATPAPSATPTPDATAAPSANVVAIQPPQVATQPGAAQVTVQPTPTPGGPEQAGQVPAQAQPGQVAGQIVPGAPGQVVLAPAPGQAGLPPGQIILLPPGQTPGQPGQPATAPDGTPLPVMSMPPTVTSSSATSIAAAAAAAAALAAAMNSTGPAPGTLTGANNTIIPQGMTPVYIPGYPPGTVMTHAQYMQIQGQAAEFAANNQLVNIGGVAQVPPLNPGDLGPHYSHHHFNTYAEFQGWKDSIQSQHGDYIVSGAVRTLKDGCRSFTLVCAVSGPYRKHRHKQGKTEPEVQAIASRPNRSKPSKKQGKMCTARMRIRHDAKDHVYVKFYPVHNHPWNPNDISHLRQLRLTASIKAKIEEQLKLNVPVKQILANVHQYQMADAIAQGATPEQQLQIKREQLINRTDIKNIQYKLQQQAAIARGEIPAKQKKPNPKRKMVIWNGPGSAPLTFNNVDPNTDPAAAVAAAQAAQAAHQAAQAAQAVQAVQQAAAQAGQQPTSTFTLQAPATTPMDTTPTPIPQTAAQAVAAAMEESAAKRQKLDHPITSAAQAVAVAMNAAQAAAQNAAATAAAQAAAAAAAQAQTAPPTLPPLPAAPPTVLPLPIIPATTTTPTPPPPPPGPAYYSCDICGMGIQGRRWHCQKCADYDVCETCYNKISAETIRRQTSPSSPPSPLFTQLLTNATDPAKHQAIQIHAEGQHPWVEESNAVAPPGSVPAPVVTAASTPAS